MRSVTNESEHSFNSLTTIQLLSHKRVDNGYFSHLEEKEMVCKVDQHVDVDLELAMNAILWSLPELADSFMPEAKG